MAPTTKTDSKKTSSNRSRRKPEAAEGSMQKEYVQGKTLCKVTFTLRQGAAYSAKGVNIVGDFNNWDTRANPMRKLKSGTWFLALVLESGRDYQFRYLIDETLWVNDRHADRYVKSLDARSNNSVVTT